MYQGNYLDLITHSKNYNKNWRILSAIWIFLTICSSILHLLVIMNPEWIGNNKTKSYFGLYNYCNNGYDCEWDLLNIKPFSIISHISFLFYLSAAILNGFAIFSIMLFVLLTEKYVFLVVSWFQLLSFVMTTIGCFIFPFSWDHSIAREICDSQVYTLGYCSVRWAYVMSIVLIFDQILLSVLGFILAKKQPQKLSEYYDYLNYCKTSSFDGSRDGKEVY
uniref:G-protein coupled receptors family 1 profile domain-containing protein n=1 Tax=Strongyloides stercoralis TaxID=6248 RepID=A0A0K0DS13_STRER